MYEQVYFSHQIHRLEQEQIERAAERRRFLREHADQIVPRPAGAFRRLLRRLVAGRTDAAMRPATDAASAGSGANPRTPTARAVDDCVGIGCEPLTATAR